MLQCKQVSLKKDASIDKIKFKEYNDNPPAYTTIEELRLMMVLGNVKAIVINLMNHAFSYYIH